MKRFRLRPIARLLSACEYPGSAARVAYCGKSSVQPRRCISAADNARSQDAAPAVAHAPDCPKSDTRFYTPYVATNPPNTTTLPVDQVLMGQGNHDGVISDTRNIGIRSCTPHYSVL